MDTRAWRETDALAHIREQIIRALPLGPEVTAPHQHWFLVEGIIHHAAGVAMRAGTRKWQDYYRENPPLPQCEGYARWPWMSESRNQHIAGVLWHEINRATDYVQKLNEWGISEYTTAQFISPSGNIHR